MSNSVYRVYIENRTVADVQAMIRANPDSVLSCDDYTEQGFIANDPETAKKLKDQLRECVNYGYQVARAAQRNAGKRHQTGTLEARWRDAVVVIDPNPESQHLMR